MKLSRRVNIQKHLRGILNNGIQGTAFFLSKYYYARETQITWKNMKLMNYTKRINISWALRAETTKFILRKTCTILAMTNWIKMPLFCSIIEALE